MLTGGWPGSGIPLPPSLGVFRSSNPLNSMPDGVYERSRGIVSVESPSGPQSAPASRPSLLVLSSLGEDPRSGDRLRGAWRAVHVHRWPPLIARVRGRRRGSHTHSTCMTRSSSFHRRRGRGGRKRTRCEELRRQRRDRLHSRQSSAHDCHQTEDDHHAEVAIEKISIEK
jgi:hypothetical protein